jgi:hypothetical protein
MAESTPTATLTATPTQTPRQTKRQTQTQTPSHPRDTPEMSSHTRDTPEMLLEAADAALFRAKADGRNCCRADDVDVGAVVIHRQPWPTCPVVVLDPISVHRVPKFLDTTRNELAALQDLDPTAATASVSRIRRTADHLGFRQLVELASGFEDALRRGDRDSAPRLIAELGWYAEHVQVVYRRPVQRPV